MNHIIHYLDQDKPSAPAKRFTDCAAALPPLDVDVDTGAVQFFKKSAVNYIRTTPVGKGTFGTIYKSADGSTIYKRITLVSDKEDKEAAELDIEEKAREIFLEAFIQTVLSCDTTYGKHVCKIKGLYRAPTKELLNRPSRNPAVAAAVAAAKPSITLYILMEPLRYNMWDIQDTLRELTGPIKLDKFLTVAMDIAKALEHFKTIYGFCHRDLHAGNIMFATGEYKDPIFIDFGLSCLKLGGITYSFVPENTLDPPELVGEPCVSYDLLILITSLHQYASADLDAQCLEFLRQSTRGENGRILLDDLSSFKHLFHPQPTAKFHMVYPNKILDKDGEMYGAIQPYLPLRHIEPAAFQTFIQSVRGQLAASGMVRYVGGGRHTFRRRGGRKRRRRTYRTHRNHRN